MRCAEEARDHGRAALSVRAIPAFALALALAHAGEAGASSAVRGNVTEYRSPTGVVERCVALEHMPGGVYAPTWHEKERELCAIDFNAGSHALCPKVFSTSPGTLVYDLRGGAYEGDAAGFERAQCGGRSVRKQGAAAVPVSYKMSVNGRATSATFANSALVYYHFSRYFDATAHVPVAVFRSIDRAEHTRRVSERGATLSAGSAALKMNHAAWQTLLVAERDPASYQPTEELFTPDGKLYGVLLHQLGNRYSEEFNGTRASGWGDGQNRDFQETAPFRALRSDKPLPEAIEEGRRAAMGDPRLAKATGRDATPAQMVFWMSDLIDITLLDFIFSQQDRIGNIDYVPFWYWVEEGAVQRREATGSTPPADIAAHQPLLLKRTELGDNDAGVRLSYVNYTKRTQMLEKLRHYRASTYERLMQLHADFSQRGPLHEYVRTTLGLSEREFQQVQKNVALAAGILHDSCSAGRLRFDIDPEAWLRDGRVTEKQVDCGTRA